MINKHKLLLAEIPENNIFGLAVFLQGQNFWGSFMTPCLKIWGSLANLEGHHFFMYNNFICLRMCQYSRYLKNVPYRKIMVVLKISARFTIGRLVIHSFCYIFCFMGIMQCCVACSQSHILQRTRDKCICYPISRRGSHCCLTVKRFTHAQTVSQK